MRTPILVLAHLRPSRSLYARIVILTNLLVFLLVGSTAILVERRHSHTIVAERQKRALELASSLASHSLNDLLSYNYVALEQNVMTLSQHPDVLYGIIMDKEGTVAADSLGGSLAGKRMEDPVSRKAAATSMPLIQEYRREPRGELVYDVAVPVDNAKKKLEEIKIIVNENADLMASKIIAFIRKFYKNPEAYSTTNEISDQLKKVIGDMRVQARTKLSTLILPKALEECVDRVDVKVYDDIYHVVDKIMLVLPNYNLKTLQNLEDQLMTDKERLISKWFLEFMNENLEIKN